MATRSASSGPAGAGFSKGIGCFRFEARRGAMTNVAVPSSYTDCRRKRAASRLGS